MYGADTRDGATPRAVIGGGAARVRNARDGRVVAGGRVRGGALRRRGRGGRGHGVSRHPLRPGATLPRADAVPLRRETVPADRFGPVAPQRGDRYGAQSEDCLYLNVRARPPSGRASGR